MRSHLRRVAIATLLLLPCTVSAQAPRSVGASAGASRAPLWATLSAGRGDLQVNCEICRRNDHSSWAADVTVGGWVGARTSLGGELGAWRLGGEEATQRVLMVSVVSQMYPLSKPSAAFVRLGLGVMTYHSTDDEQSLSARSLALQAGFGYDFPVRQRYIVVPFATLVHGFNNGLYLDDQRVTGASQMKLLRFGLGVGVRR
jgi:hypothetical protein